MRDIGHFAYVDPVAEYPVEITFVHLSAIFANRNVVVSGSATHRRTADLWVIDGILVSCPKNAVNWDGGLGDRSFLGPGILAGRPRKEMP